LTEVECQKIVKTGLLTSKRFPKDGILGRGQSRGFWLEIDRVNPKENYSVQNCVLSCYFCNNDKSDVFDGENYKDFMKNRVGFLRKILSK
jgi:5-methylcytosine-specific restriction endonuclease McrA